MKKLSIFFLALVASAGTLFAQSGNCGMYGSNVTWTLSNGVLTISGSGEMAEWSTTAATPSWYAYRSSIQSVVIEEGVTSIGKCAFYDYENLTSVSIANTVTSINTLAFYFCEGLTSLSIPASVTNFEIYAVYGCGNLTDINVASGNTVYSSKNGVLFNKNKSAILLYPLGKTATSYTIPSSVTTVADNSFQGCGKLTSITIPNGVVNIGNSTFARCHGLKTITLPASVKTTGSEAFQFCNGLNTIICEATTPPTFGNKCFDYVDNSIPMLVPAESVATYRAHAGWSYFTNIQSKDCGAGVTWKLIDGVLTISGNGPMSSFGGPFDSENPVPWANCRSEIQSVVIESGVTSIGANAFNVCSNMSSITIANTVEAIGLKAFEDCSGLTGVALPASLTEIGSGAFMNCTGLQYISCAAQTPPECNTLCFSGVTKSIPVYVPDGKVPTYKGATGWSDFSKIQTGNSTTSGQCGDNLYWSLRDNGTLSIYGTGAMWDYVLETPFTYSISTAPWFGDGSENQTILAVELPEGLTSIGNYAFYKCTKIATVNIPNSVTEIGKYAFYNGKALANLTMSKKVAEIGEFAFFQCTSLKSIMLPETLTSIGQYGFALCTGLTSITCEALTPPVCGTECFANVTKSIPVYVPCGKEAAYQATEAKEWKDFTNFQIHTASGTCGDNVTWSLSCDGVLTISGTGDMTSWDWDHKNDIPWKSYRSNILSVVIENGVTRIGTYAFEFCSKLKEVSISNSVTVIGMNAFNGCTNLTSVTIPNSVKILGMTAFYDCTNLTSVTLPDGLSKIMDVTFRNCISLTSVTIPASVTFIGEGAFYGCTGLTSITSEAVNPPACEAYCFNHVDKSIPVYVPAGTKAAYKNAAGWNEFINIQEVGDPVVPTGIAYQLVDLSTETLTAGKYIIVFDDNKAHAEVGGSQKKDLIASSDELNIVGNTAYVPEGTACDVTIAPFGVGEYSILLAGDTVYLDLQAKNSVTTSKTASGFGITDGGDQTVQISKVLASDSKTYVLKYNSSNDGYFRMYSNNMYTLPRLFRKPADSPTGVEQTGIRPSAISIQKVLRDGQIYIMRDGKTYSVDGRMIK